VVKNVLILKGSPRQEGNSAILAEQAAAGAKQAGGQVETVSLHELDIRPCDACDMCQGSVDIDCVIEDDMQALYPKVRAADAIVYASPVYWFSVSAQLKLFIDRCYGIWDEEEAPEDSDLAGKKIGVVLTYGGNDPYESGAINAIRMFQDMFRYVPSEIVDIVYGYAMNEGEIKGNAEVMKRAFDLGTKLAGE
jgi:multimeric flavodoxin WrbA